MTARRWTDAEGHAWPLTGQWCNTCGLPLIRVSNLDTHPTCEPEADQ